jgi:NTE family protein
MRRLLILLLLCCWTLPAAVAGAAADVKSGNTGTKAGLGPIPDHPRIGLVLSGGGARGAAHIGVLKVLEELRIPISAVVGTSMGALVGGTYATGVSPTVMERELTAVDWKDLFEDNPPRQDWPIRRKEQSMQPKFDFSLGVDDHGKIKLPQGAVAGQKVEMLFSDLVSQADGVQRFDDLPISFRAVATDLENGDMKVFDAGPLPEVMRASMSVPGVFAPVHIDHRIYVDGGLVRNLPVDVARGMGVDLVIAVNLGGSYLPRDELNSVIGVLDQMVAILTEQNVVRSLATLRPGKDVLISPDLGNLSSDDFDQTARAIRLGEIAGKAAASRLRHLSLSPAAWETWKASRPRPQPVLTSIAEVQIRGLDHPRTINPHLFDPLIRHQQGQPLNRRRLESDLAAIYSRGDFQNLNYHFELPSRPGERTDQGQAATPATQSGSRPRLIINAREKPWGPGYLRFGLDLHSDLSGEFDFGLTSSYRRTWINALGAEWYTTAKLGVALGFNSEFYQPLTVDRAFFIAPWIGIDSTPSSVFIDGTRRARYNVIRQGLGLDLGATLFDGQAELRIGATLAEMRADRDTGYPEVIESSINESGLRASFVYDTLDHPFLPHHGQRMAFELLSPQPAMGAQLNYNRLSGRWTGAFSRGKHSLVGRAMAGTAIGTEMPLFDQFALGGFLQLSGYATNQFRANRFGLGSVSYAYQIANLPTPLGRGVYLGGSLEVGSLHQTDVAFTLPGVRFGGSLFLGAETWLGPTFLALGMNGEGDANGYLIIGRP